MSKKRVLWCFGIIGAGAACLFVVVLTHIAERFHIFPVMGWGLPNSPGHYLDLTSAVTGCVLLLLGTILKYRDRSFSDKRSSTLNAADDAVAIGVMSTRKKKRHSLPT